jgi:acetyl esterase/lipase
MGDFTQFRLPESKFNYDLKGEWDPDCLEGENFVAKLPRVNYWLIRLKRWMTPQNSWDEYWTPYFEHNEITSARLGGKEYHPDAETQTCFIHRPNFGDTSRTIVYFHGGGIILGTAENYRNIASKIAFYTNCTVVNCNYRLCPEVKFPTPVHDAYAIVKHILAQSTVLGLGKRVILMGESAAAGLIVAVAQEMVKRGEIDKISLLVPISIFGDHLVSGEVPYSEWT